MQNLPGFRWVLLYNVNFSGSIHPPGPVNAFSVSIGMAVRFCSGIMELAADCFNIPDPDGVNYMRTAEKIPKT